MAETLRLRWGTVQNRRANREAPEDAFARAGNRIIVIRDKFLPWWISGLSPARCPPVLPPRRGRRRQRTEAANNVSGSAA